MVNKNKTIINNKNIIQICNLKTKRQRQTKRQSGDYSSSNNPGANNPDTNLYTKNIPSYYSPANTFPNSSALEDESKRVRFLTATLENESNRQNFINAMRDPTATKSPYSIFNNGSNTFQREGNTTGPEQPIQPQISQSDYFTNPRVLARPPMRFNTSQNFDTTVSPIPQREFYDDESPYREDLRQQQEQYDLMRQQQEQQTRFSMPLTRGAMPPLFTSPYKGPGAIDHEAIAREEQARAEQEARQKEEKEFQVVESKRTAKLRAEQEAQQAEQAQLESLREDEERQRVEKLKIAQKEARERLGKELERKKEVQRKFKNVSDKLNQLISTGETKVKKDSALKTQIKQLLGDPTFTEFTGNRNIGAMADAQKILKFLNEGSTTVLSEIKRIEDDKIELEKHLTRQTPAGRGNIHTLEAGGGGKVGGNPAIR